MSTYPRVEAALNQYNDDYGRANWILMNDIHIRFCRALNVESERCWVLMGLRSERFVNALRRGLEASGWQFENRPEMKCDPQGLTLYKDEDRWVVSARGMKVIMTNKVR